MVFRFGDPELDTSLFEFRRGDVRISPPTSAARRQMIKEIKALTCGFA